MFSLVSRIAGEILSTYLQNLNHMFEEWYVIGKNILFFIQYVHHSISHIMSHLGSSNIKQ